MYSTFIGGSSIDLSYSMDIDKSGNAYITGMTNSSDYPTTYGVYDGSYNSDYDVFLTMLNTAGSDISYSTFLGGERRDWALEIFVDENDEDDTKMKHLLAKMKNDQDFKDLEMSEITPDVVKNFVAKQILINYNLQKEIKVIEQAFRDKK